MWLFSSNPMNDWISFYSCMLSAFTNANILTIYNTFIFASIFIKSLHNAGRLSHNISLPKALLMFWQEFYHTCMFAYAIVLQGIELCSRFCKTTDKLPPALSLSRCRLSHNSSCQIWIGSALIGRCARGIRGRYCSQTLNLWVMSFDRQYLL